MVRKVKRFNVPEPLRIRYVVSAAIVVFLGIGIFNLVHGFVLASPYFKINKVDIVLIGRVPLGDRTVKDLLTVHKGRNIFEVDLKATREYILLHYPEIRTLVINRAFPNKLVLNIRPRRPVVQASTYAGFYFIDGECIVLPGVKGLVSEGLPIISGIDSRLILGGIGKRCDYPGLRNALRLIDIINQMKFSQEHEIHMIDVADEKNLSLYIEGGIEIKMGAENFRERIGMLNKTFETGRLDKSQIKYIDLRFGNVIIGPK